MSATNHSKRALKIMFHKIGIYMFSGESRGGGPRAWAPPPSKCLMCSKLELFSKIYKKMS